MNTTHSLFKEACDRMQTRYRLYEEPIHLFNEELVNLCGLQPVSKKESSDKVVFTAKYRVNTDDYTLTFVSLDQSLVTVTKDNTLTYEDAGRYYIGRYSCGDIVEGKNDKRVIIDNLVRITETLRIQSGRTINASYVTITGGNLILVENSTILLKSAIEELAILCNDTVAEILYRNNIHTIFRACSGGEFAPANTTSTLQPHDKLKSQNYTHFTSPLRRVLDCVVHFCIRIYIVQRTHGIKIQNPFDGEMLERFIGKYDATSKYLKQLGYFSQKYAMVEYLYTNVVPTILNLNIKNFRRNTLVEIDEINGIPYIPKISFKFSGNVGLPSDVEKLEFTNRSEYISDYPSISSFVAMDIHTNVDDNVIPMCKEFISQVFGFDNNIYDWEGNLLGKFWKPDDGTQYYKNIFRQVVSNGETGEIGGLHWYIPYMELKDNTLFTDYDVQLVDEEDMPILYNPDLDTSNFVKTNYGNIVGQIFYDGYYWVKNESGFDVGLIGADGWGVPKEKYVRRPRQSLLSD